MSYKAFCCCEQLSLVYEGDINKSSICHCFACQKRTGSVFGAQVRLMRKQVTIEGLASKYVRSGDSGGFITFSFCPTCATTLYWEPDGMPESIIVAAGCFANPELAAPTFSVYEERMHHWVKLPDSIVEHMD